MTRNQKEKITKNISLKKCAQHFAYVGILKYMKEDKSKKNMYIEKNREDETHIVGNTT